MSLLRPFPLLATLTLLVCGPGASAGSLVALDYSSPSSSGSNAYRMDTATGTRSLIGPVGFAGLNSAATGLDGSIYSVGYVLGTFTRHLIQIDPQTGAGTSVAPITPSSPCGVCSTEIGSLAIHPTTGTAIGSWAGARYEVDLVTGALSALAPLSGASRMQGMTYSPDGVLWGWDLDLGLVTISASGAATDVNPLVGADADIQSIEFKNGALYGANGNFFQIDTETGASTDMGWLGFISIRGLAYVPEPSSFALWLSGVVLAVGASRTRAGRGAGSRRSSR